jgi:hypothetical protein
MLFGFTISSLGLFLALFGLFQLSEIGFLSGAAEQAGFFAARSEFVGLRGSLAGTLAAHTALDRAGSGTVDVDTEESPPGRLVRVSFAAPEPFALLAKTSSGARCAPRLTRSPHPRLCGFTLIPPRTVP